MTEIDQAINLAVSTRRIPAHRADFWRERCTADPRQFAILAALQPLPEIRATASGSDAIYAAVYPERAPIRADDDESERLYRTVYGEG